MRSEPNLTATLTIRLTPEMKGYLKERARREHRKMSNVVYTIIDDAIQQDQVRLSEVPASNPINAGIKERRYQPRTPGLRDSAEAQ
jgi:predicted transcriptional regulator